MNSAELSRLGVLGGEAKRLAGPAVKAALDSGRALEEIRVAIRALARDPSAGAADPHFAAVAAAIAAERDRFTPRATPAPWQQWGSDLDSQSIAQMQNACSLPVSARGALMPDAHVGYGLPIGGVLATRNAVIPYAVGVDIACRMKLTVIDIPPSALEDGEERLVRALEGETRFGIGAKFRRKRLHPVLDEDWSVTETTRRVKDRAWAQLGTSGSGNHFVEFGTLAIASRELGIEPGTYLALLSHSGSRGSGAEVAGHYSRLARELHPELPRELSHLAWLDLDTSEGQEYWAAMELMGKYAAANHACIHRHIRENLGAQALLDLENHHNFAWKEEHDGETLIVHRKGATPAGKGVIGIIPGSMAAPGYVVMGEGNPDSLNSASHGAGRRMSRTRAMDTFTWEDARKVLQPRRVKLLSAGLDEAPMAYKDIEEVMAAQKDLVRPLARFDPRLVKMAPAGERPED
jgi:tRNA-splicing ligase RtcB